MLTKSGKAERHRRALEHSSLLLDSLDTGADVDPRVDSTIGIGQQIISESRSFEVDLGPNINMMMSVAETHKSFGRRA